MELELLSSRINLNHICLKMQVSIDDIKTKHPNRTDLISSMEQSLHEIKKAMSLHEIKKAMLVYQTLEKEFRSARQMNFDLQRINLEQLQEIQNFKRQIELNNMEL